ncbi:MAG: DsbA family oxidoreductase [Alphaproteobacteria bacterium]|nr:DsbA family oxidoreductase [Alphaproteobacteria bacterium]
MRIDIVADVICPWCFIGKRRLETALAQRPNIAPDITWRPFQLNPDMPVEGMPREAYLAAKFGGQAHAKRINQAAIEAGASVGIPFAFEKIERTPNTLAAHRLVRFAQREGHATELVDRLFAAYFIEGRDTGDRDTLAAIAGESGLDAATAHDFLASTSERAEVLADDAGARRLGINAVPCFIFAGQYAISGAQEPPFFFPVFDLVQNGPARAAG